MNEEFVDFPATDKTLPFFISLAGITHKDRAYKIIRPNSNCLCLEYILEGEGYVVYNGKTYHLKEGDSYLLPPGKDHYYFSNRSKPWEKIWFNAEGSLINNLLSVYNLSDAVIFKNCNIYEYIYNVHLIGKNNSLSTAAKHERSSLIFHEILQFLYNHNQKPGFSSETELIKNHIENNLSQNITLSELSKLVYLSESQVIRLFKRETGKTPYDYILDLKISRAKNLLINTNLMVKQIASSLGFCDEHYFSYIFRKKTNRTPSQYRKEG